MEPIKSIAAFGAGGRSDADLLSALGVKAHTLSEVLTGAFVGANTRERAKAECLAELVRRASRPTEQMPRISSPRSAGEYLLPRLRGLTEEVFGILALDAKGKLIADRVIGKGISSGVLISPREVFREAIRLGAVSVLAYHNHPGGDPTPSREDIAITRKMRLSGEVLSVPFADHMVIGSESWHSFRVAEGWDTER